MSKVWVYRVQDAQEGRGPYRPHLSRHWVDADHDARNPPLEKAFPQLTLQDFKLRGTHDAYGFGFRDKVRFRRWFSESERLALEFMGFWPVHMWVNEVIAESDQQLLFWRSRPLTDYVRWLNWAEMDV